MTALTPAQVEQRRAIRILCRDLKIMYDGCTEWVDVRSPDLSTDGMFINTPRAFAISCASVPAERESRMPGGCEGATGVSARMD